ncbi:MAG: shikimate kinase [Cytophagales bacterium]|nr:shikimate kinase [Cytophagales bacterium]
MKIFLLGLPGSGKTTLGKAVAEDLWISFIDLDYEIEQAAGISIQRIFKQLGEKWFRQMESAQLKRWCAWDGDFVMATGGGTPVFDDNLDLMNRTGKTIFIDVPAVTLTERILKTDVASRPLFANTHRDNLKDQIEFMRSQRMPFYRQAHYRVAGEEKLKEIITILRKESQP